MFGHRYPANSYNAWGYGIHGGKGFYFSSWDGAIDYISEDIKHKFFDQGLVTPYAMNEHYSSNPDWGWQVDYYIQELDTYSKDFMTKFGPEINSYNQKIRQANQLARILPPPTQIKVNASSLSLVPAE